MANCTYCGNPAGLFKKIHKECESKSKAGWIEMVETVRSVIVDNGPFSELQVKLPLIAASSFIPKEKVPESLRLGFNKAIDCYLDDELLSENEENRITEFLEHFSLSQNELDDEGYFTKMVMAGTLRDLYEGKIPSRIKVSGASFNLQKGEELVWIFPSVAYFTEKTKTEFVGGSTGVSVRVAKGVYLRSSGFKGHPVQTTQTVLVDVGAVGVTTKHIYFTGASKSFRIRYPKIVSFAPYEDGIGLFKEAANPKQEIFKTGNGWFVYNLITHLSKQDE